MVLVLIAVFLFINTDSHVAVEVEKIVTNSSLCKDIKSLSGGAQTSYLEAFHSLLVQFAPKTYVYGYTGMLCRCVKFNCNKLHCTLISYNYVSATGVIS